MSLSPTATIRVTSDSARLTLCENVRTMANRCQCRACGRVAEGAVLKKGDMRSELNADVGSALSAIEGRQVSHVFLVACGGSLSIMHPGKYLLDRHAPELPCDIYNAGEFVCRKPIRLGEDALVILCSQTGTTKETVAAARFARERGAATIAMSLDLSSPLARAADHAVKYRAHYTTGERTD